MGRKDKKPVETPPSPPPPTTVAPTTTTNSSTTASSSSTSTAPNTAISSPSPSPSSPSSSDDGDSVSSDTPPPPPPQPQTQPPSQPRSKPPSAAVATTTLALPATSAKRPVEKAAGDASAAAKRAKKELPPGTTPQKALFQRLWSDEDEIVILKGMIEYRGLKGSDPMSNVDDFLEFIKKSLHVHDANRAQIVSKVRRLKNRFLNAKKAENDGKKKRISDPHEVEVLELSKRIWLGPELGDDKRVVVDNGGVVTVAAVAAEKGKKNVADLGVEFGFSREEEAVLKEGLKVMGGVEKVEVEKAVQKANVAYMEAYLLKLKVLEIAAKKVLQGIRDDKC